MIVQRAQRTRAPAVSKASSGADPAGLPDSSSRRSAKDHRVGLQRRAVGAVRDPPQRPLLDEAELARDREARRVLRVGADLDSLHAAHLERDSRERRRRLGREALAGPACADPVADLEHALAAPRVQPGSADGLGLVRREDRVDELLPEVELAAEAPQELHGLLQRHRQLVRPRQPRAKVLEARVDRRLEQRRVARLPAANDQPLGDDPIRRRAQNLRRVRAASKTRSADGMYASSICQYGYGTS